MRLPYKAGQIVRFQIRDQRESYGICTISRGSSMQVYSETGDIHNISASTDNIMPVPSLEDVPEITAGTFTRVNRRRFIENFETIQSIILKESNPF